MTFKRKERVTFGLIMSCIATAALWAGFLLLMFNLAGCGGDAVANKGGGGGPPDPPTYDYEESEPNDSFEDANFITILPVFTPETIGGHLALIADDLDYFYFFLNPALGDDEILINIKVQT